MNQTIQEIWEEFRREVLHPRSPPDQVREMRRAFFGGAIAVILSGDLSEPAIAKFTREVTQFRTDILNGKA